MIASDVYRPFVLDLLLARRKETEGDRFWHAFSRKWEREEKRVIPVLRAYFRAERDKVLPLVGRLRLSAGIALQADETKVNLDQIEDLFGKVQIKVVAQFSQRITKSLRLIGRSFASNTAIYLKKSFPGLPAATSEWLRSYVPKFVDQINQTSHERILGQILEGIREGDSFPQITERVRQAYQGFIRSRAPLIASQETGVISSQVQQDVLRTLDIPTSELEQTWLTARDNRVRDSHQALEGQKRRIGEEFLSGLKFPRDPNASTDETIGCRCVLLVKRVATRTVST